MVSLEKNTRIAGSSSSLSSEVLLSILKQDSTWFNERCHLSVFWFLELLNKKAPLLRCSCRIGWKRWSVLIISSMSITFCVIAWGIQPSVSSCLVSSGKHPVRSFWNHSFLRKTLTSSERRKRKIAENWTNMHRHHQAVLLKNMLTSMFPRPGMGSWGKNLLNPHPSWNTNRLARPVWFN